MLGFIGFICLISHLASAKITIIKENKKNLSFRSPASLKEFGLIEQKKEILYPGDKEIYVYKTTDVRIILKTKSVADIEKFGIVQFIKGCRFQSEKQPDGKILKRTDTYSRMSAEGLKDFVHKDWEVDTDNADPLYSAIDDELSRYALFRWNTNPKDFENLDEAPYYLEQAPPHPVVFLTDLPSQGGRIQVPPTELPKAANVSLEFKTCLFKIEDLPKSTDNKGSAIDKKKALACLDWDNKFVYNWKTNKIESPKTIDPVCLN